MTLLWLPVGCALPALIGWLLLSLLEGRSPVLFRGERWILGFVLGLTFTMFATFLLSVTGFVVLTRNYFLLVQASLAAILAIALFLSRRFSSEPFRSLPPRSSSSAPKWLKIAVFILALWTVVKIAAGSFILVSTPPYFDDTLKNWNLRGKAFFLTHQLVLNLHDSTGNEISPLSSYPPTVSLSKTWLASLAGTWDEGLVNSIHVAWFLALLALLYFAIRRHASSAWSFLGAYLLGSLPLELFQGVNAYADVFLSVHLFAAVTLLFHAGSSEARERSSFLRLGALSAALLVFTKNEALVIFLPILLFLLLFFLFILLAAKRISPRKAAVSVLWYAGLFLLIALPWLVFKWANGLGFGNAKSFSDFSFGWQPKVLNAIWTNTFFEGNWLLLFPLFLFLLAACWRRVLASGPYLILSLFVLGSISLQLFLFLFTSLSVEAAYQTGLARGFLQIAPLVVLLVSLLLRDAFERASGD